MTLTDFQEAKTLESILPNGEPGYAMPEQINEYLASPYAVIGEKLVLTGKIIANRKVWVNGVIKGDLISNSEVWINGEVEGAVHAPSIVVGEAAQITGSLLGDKVVVNGRIEGSVYGVRVRLEPNAYVLGDIHHQFLIIEEGAYFAGRGVPTTSPPVLLDQGARAA